MLEDLYIEEDFELVDWDDRWQNQFNGELFKELKTKQHIKVYGCLIRTIHLSDDATFVLLYSPTNQPLGYHIFQPGESIDILTVANSLMGEILQYIGEAFMVMRLFGDKYVREHKTEVCDVRDTVHIITSAMRKLGGYFHLKSEQEGEEIFKNTYEAICSRQTIKPSDKMHFESEYVNGLYREIEAVVNSMAEGGGL